MAFACQVLFRVNATGLAISQLSLCHCELLRLDQEYHPYDMRQGGHQAGLLHVSTGPRFARLLTITPRIDTPAARQGPFTHVPTRFPLCCLHRLP